LINNMTSLNLIMRKTIIEMILNLKDLTPVHDTFHGVIPGQSSMHRPVGVLWNRGQQGQGGVDV
jgi:hypothetical protein